MEYDLSNMDSLELAVMQKELRELTEDKNFLNAVLKELGRRQKKDSTSIRPED